MSRAFKQLLAAALVATMLASPVQVMAGYDKDRPDPRMADGYKDEIRWITKEIVKLKHERLPRAEGPVKEAVEQLIAAEEGKAEAVNAVIKAYHQGTHADVLAAINAKEAAAYNVHIGWERVNAREKQQHRAIDEGEASEWMKWLDKSLVPHFQKAMRARRSAGEAWKAFANSLADNPSPTKVIEGKVEAMRQDMEHELANAEFDARRRALEFANRAMKHESREMGKATKELWAAELDLIKAERTAGEARIRSEQARAQRDTIRQRLEQMSRAAEQQAKQEAAKEHAKKVSARKGK